MFAHGDLTRLLPISAPDHVAFDSYGNLWAATDSGQKLGTNDGLYGVVLEGRHRGRTALFASVPVGAKCCGPIVTDDFLLISAQHPGDLDGASPEEPDFPGGPGSQPRPSVVNIWRMGKKGPGKIGR